MDRRNLLLLIAGRNNPTPEPAPHSFKRQAPRPPQAAIEPLFLRSCDGCGACEAVCPERVICMDRGKPIVDFTCGTCNMCGKCTEVCPREALQPDILFDTGTRPFFEHGCDLYQKQACRTCIERCPVNALSTAGVASPQLISTQCNGCGMCYQACPQKQISLRISA